MSPLRLDFRISLFTGVMAAFQYIILSFWALDNYLPIEDTGEVISFPGLHIAKGVLLIAGGFIAGFVAKQLHVRIKGLFSMEKEKNSIRMLFGQQVSPQVMSALTTGKRKMIGANLEVTVMFLDIRDFTPFAESCTPDEIVNFQNAIFGPFIEIVHQYNGIVNQILGDGFMATFGAPVTSETHPNEAVKAGIDILQKVDSLIKQKRIPSTKIGIGLHTGKVIAGNIGNNIRQQYSIIGTTVITAARIEQLNKTYKTQFLISKSTFKRLNEIDINKQFKHVDTTDLKGMEDQVEIYSYENTAK
jgi:adenylate cyclase